MWLGYVGILMSAAVKMKRKSYLANTIILNLNLTKIHIYYLTNTKYRSNL